MVGDNLFSLSQKAAGSRQGLVLEVGGLLREDDAVNRGWLSGDLVCGNGVGRIAHQADPPLLSGPVPVPAGQRTLLMV